MGEFPENWAVRNLLIRKLLGAISKTKTKITGFFGLRFKVERKRNPKAALGGGLERGC